MFMLSTSTYSIPELSNCLDLKILRPAFLLRKTSQRRYYIMAGPKLDFGGFPIPWTPTNRPEDETNMYPYRKQTRNTRTLPVGWKFAEGRRPFHQETIFDEVVEIPLRDGVKVCQTLKALLKTY